MKVGIALLSTLLVAAATFVGAGTASSNGVTASATGAGQSTFGGEQRTFAFAARQYADGSVKGELQLNNRSQDRVFHMTLDCLVVNGTTAYASGIVDHSTLPSDVGTEWDVAVRDNGEGTNAPPDQISLVYIFFPQLPCTNLAVQAFLNGALFPIDSGNIQVH
jgi:hypothetical protein